MRVQILCSLLPFLAGLTAAAPQPATTALAVTATSKGVVPATTLPTSDDDKDVNLDDLRPEEDTEEVIEVGDSEEGGEGGSDDLAKRGTAWWRWTSAKPAWSWKNWRGKQIAKGEYMVRIWSDGNVQFYTRFKATRARSFDYGITCAFRDQGGYVYQLSRKGRICNNIRGCGRVDEVDRKVYNRTVRDRWAKIMAGNRKLHCKAELKWAGAAFLNKLLSWIKENWGQVAKIIAVFVAA